MNIIGFLGFDSVKEPLDRTRIHPELYPICLKFAKEIVQGEGV